MFQDTILTTSKLSSKILSFLTVGNQITHLYTTTGKVTVSYTLMQFWLLPDKLFALVLSDNSLHKTIS